MDDKKEERKKGFVWKSLRIGFWIVIVYLIFDYIGGYFLKEALANFYKTQLGLIISLAFVALVIFNFIVSIIHLLKHKKKALAIIALIVSSALIFFLFIGIVISAIRTSFGI